MPNFKIITAASLAVGTLAIVGWRGGFSESVSETPVESHPTLAADASTRAADRATNHPTTPSTSSPAHLPASAAPAPAGAPSAGARPAPTETAAAKSAADKLESVRNAVMHEDPDRLRARIAEKKAREERFLVEGLRLEATEVQAIHEINDAYALRWKEFGHSDYAHAMAITKERDQRLLTLLGPERHYKYTDFRKREQEKLTESLTAASGA